jgi:catechol 2,3-dioxygenase-like lactoylglutathione lyase family enzyme
VSDPVRNRATIKGLHHVGVAVSDMAQAEAFYVGILGLVPCPAKPNWLSAGTGFEIHLMPSRSGTIALDAARHFTLEVERLEEAAQLLLAHGLRPYQLTVDQAHRHDVTMPGDTLDFGIGTIFVEDPDGNTIEFLQSGRGISAQILGGSTGAPR